MFQLVIRRSERISGETTGAATLLSRLFQLTFALCAAVARSSLALSRQGLAYFRHYPKVDTGLWSGLDMFRFVLNVIRGAGGLFRFALSRLFEA